MKFLLLATLCAIAGLSHAALSSAQPKQLNEIVTPLTKEVLEKVDTLTNFLFSNLVYNRQINISTENMLSPKNIINISKEAKNSSLYKGLNIYSQIIYQIVSDIIKDIIKQSPQADEVKIGIQLAPRLEGILKAILSAIGNLKGDQLVVSKELIKGGEFNGRFLKNIGKFLVKLIEPIYKAAVTALVNKGVDEIFPKKN